MGQDVNEAHYSLQWLQKANAPFTRRAKAPMYRLTEMMISNIALSFFPQSKKTHVQNCGTSEEKCPQTLESLHNCTMRYNKKVNIIN